MIKSEIKKNTRIIILMVGILIITFILYGKYETKVIQEGYRNFLNGEVSTVDKNGKSFFLEELFEDKNGITHFFSDINSDGIEELHIRDLKIYYILSYRNGELDIIFEGSAYDKPIEKMSGILYYREGAAPYHETYRFTQVEKDGTTIEGATYEWYDGDGDEKMGIEDIYLKDGIEQDKASWEQETEVYQKAKNIEEKSYLERTLEMVILGNPEPFGRPYGELQSQQSGLVGMPGHGCD